MWNYAIDQRKDEGILPLERVPRLTVTQRDIQLPQVQDLLQWRSANRRRREQRKAQKEAERNPKLDEMLTAIFGAEDMDLLQLDEAQLQKLKASEALDSARAELGGSPRCLGALGVEEVETPSAHQQRLKMEELELLKEIRLILSEDVDEAVEAFEALDPKLLGALRHGRRGAFDEGKASAKLALSIADLQARQDKNVVRCKKLRRGVEHTRALRSLPPDRSVNNEEVAELHMKEVLQVLGAVVDRCCRRSQRLHDAFVQRQGLLSARLQRRVKRLRYDHCEIQSKKQQSILPCVISHLNDHLDETNGDKNTNAFLSVLSFLKPHRTVVEKQRREVHRIYLRQVEKIQHFQRLLADPNRCPERGEIYLSQCFRHVLLAGLAVDKSYFFRVLRHLEPEDFQEVFTVNFLAACCDAFAIPVRDYAEYLKLHGLPSFAPMTAPSHALPYDDTAAWDAVTLGPLKLVHIGDEATLADVPLFPVLPTATPRTSELASRDDPLHEILRSTVYDAVLERYSSPRAAKVVAAPTVEAMRRAMRDPGSQGRPFRWPPPASGVQHTRSRWSAAGPLCPTSTKLCGGCGAWRSPWQVRQQPL
ncbi:unnamed protein product [Durusdinium trenchii]|uniref:Uncharacterized protein n=1 Tax=Durusdinium trenchii TaxID=1381693 RepID=A0ABP0M3F6_9DINO